MTTSPVVTITDELVAELEKERQRRFDGNELNSKELTQLHAANQRLEMENAQLKSALASNTARRYVGDADQRTIDELVAAGIRVDQQEIKRLEGEVARMREALAGLVKINELHNQAVVAVTGKPGGWNDDYLNEARAALSTANDEVTE